MKRIPGPGRRPMTARAGRLAGNEPGRAAEPMLAFGAGWRGVVCSGCGQRPEDLSPFDALAVIRELHRRSAVLLRRREDSLRHRREAGAWSAMEPAERVADGLGAANSRLRDLLGEDPQEPDPVTFSAPGVSVRRSPTTVLAALTDNVGHLVATVDGATADDWYHRRHDSGATAGEVVWLALHDLTHQLEDAERLVDVASASDPEPRYGGVPPSN